MTENYFVEDIENNELIETDPGEILMTEKDARQLTESIKSTTQALCIMLKKAHDEKVWKVIGYNSWTEYIENEFDFTRVRSYQLLAQAKVIEEISDAAGAEMYLTEKDAKVIKKELPLITKKIKEGTEDLEDEEERKNKAESIVDGEIAHAMKNDKDTYDDSKDIDSMIEEDGGQPQEIGYSNGNTQSQEDRNGEVYTESENEESLFYYNNLKRTISIIEQLPQPDELVSDIIMNNNEKRMLSNRIEGVIDWMSTLLDKLK